jgi:hypothetical protein
MSEQSTSIQNQIKIHKRNLSDLEIRKAKYGLDVPVSIMRQIEDEQAEILRLESELTSLSSKNTTINQITGNNDPSKTELLKTFLQVLGTIVVAFITYLGTKTMIYAPIEATQTAQTQFLSLTQTASVVQIAFAPTNTLLLTPTSTNTPEILIISPTSTIEPLVTPTPELPVMVRLPNKNELGKFRTIYGYDKDYFFPTETTDAINIYSHESFFWSYAFCGKSQEKLDEFIKNVPFRYFIDEVEVPESFFYSSSYTSNISVWPCRKWTTVLTAWKPGHLVTLTVSYNIRYLISDGEHNYQPGNYRFVLRVNVKE